MYYQALYCTPNNDAAGLAALFATMLLVAAALVLTPLSLYPSEQVRKRENDIAQYAVDNL